MIRKRKQKKPIEEEQNEPVEKKLNEPIEEIEVVKNKPINKKQIIQILEIIGVILGIIIAIITICYIDSGEPDFNISVNPMQDTVIIGNTAQTRITVKGIKGYNYSVGLGASGQSSGLKVTFNPQSAVTDPEFNSEMVIHVDSHTSEGTDTIVVKGTGADGKEHSCKYFLKINSRPLLRPSQFYMVYSDMGIVDGDVWVWSGADNMGLPPPALIDGSYSEISVPEGEKCFAATSGSGNGNYVGWGVFLGSFNNRHELIRPHTVNLSLYNSLIFSVKTSVDLKVELQQDSNDGEKSIPCFISNFGWNSQLSNVWQQVVIPRSAFRAIDLTRIFCPFMITGIGSQVTFYIDDVRWAL
jgi:hypothetical protein